MNRLLFTHSTRSAFCWANFLRNRIVRCFACVNTNKSSIQMVQMTVTARQLPFELGYLVSMCSPPEHRHRTKSPMCGHIRKCIASSIWMAVSAWSERMQGKTNRVCWCINGKCVAPLGRHTEMKSKYGVVHGFHNPNRLFFKFPRPYALCACVWQTNFLFGGNIPTTAIGANLFPSGGELAWALTSWNST